MPHRPAFLDVRRSARGHRWVERLSAWQANVALDIAQTHGIEDVIARVIAARGVSVADAPAFLQPTIRDLMPDPSAVTDLDRAAERIAGAVMRGQRIAIFGDYDVDGAASSALLARYLGHFGLAPKVHIPDRIFEGYGPNPAAMKALAAEADLIVTVDCGTNSAAAFEAAGPRMADIVVIDHHQVGGPLPQVAAVVNPNREDDLSGLGHLCAAGVTFMVLVGVTRLLREAGRNNLPDLMGLTDLVALATVCDVVPLTGLNRAFVRTGLQVARRLSNPGIAALASVARVAEPLNPYHFGFMLGPRINAGGRIGDASLGARLLSLSDQAEARDLAARLDQLNAERQAIEKAMVDEAKAGAEREMQSARPPAVIVTASPDYHPGIAGLIAARLKEAFGRPALAIAVDANGRGTGSARSIAGFDIGKLVRTAVEEGLLIKGGGHAMAAGVTVEAGRIGALRAFFEERAADAVASLTDETVLEVDSALTSGGANEALVNRLQDAGPFGAGNPEPLFVLPRHVVTFVKPVGTGHVKVGLQYPGLGTLDAIAFRAADEPVGRLLAENRGGPVHVAGTLSLNHWNGRATPQLRIIDAAPAV